jgi:hypothetical protein
MVGTAVRVAAPDMQVTSRLALLAEIDASKTIRTRITQDENLLIVHTIANPVGEYWDIAYGDNLSDPEIQELLDLEERVWKDYGVLLIDVTIERQENQFPHPLFPSSPNHTYVRICPKAAR